MGRESKLRLIADDELVDISGGGVVWTGEDTIEVYNCCTVCDKRELVYSGSVNRSLRIEGTFVCEDCGVRYDWTFRL